MYLKSDAIKQLEDTHLEAIADSNSKRLGVSLDDLVRIDSFDEGYSISNTFYGRFLSACVDNEKTGIQEQKYQIARELMNYELGMLLVRPDYYHFRDQVINFIMKNSFDVVLASPVQVNSYAYSQMYKHVIDNPDTKFVMPTRTLVYTSGESYIIIFRDSLGRASDQGVLCPDFFCKHFKGVQGKPQRNTVRGEVIYDAAKGHGYDKLNRQITALALDPTKDYRHLIREGITDKHLKLAEGDQLLEYVGVGTHVPDSNEFPRDLSLILSLSDLQFLRNLFINEQ